MQYYYIHKGQQQGPVDESLLVELGVTAQTPVWCNGMSQWTPAGKVPELAQYFAPAAQEPTPSPYQNPYGPQAEPRYYNPEQMPAPQNYLVWAILSTICCCWPLGIVAIIKASQVNGLNDRGLYAEAHEAARSARTWTIVAFVLGIVGNIISFLYYFSAAFVSLM